MYLWSFSHQLLWNISRSSIILNLDWSSIALSGNLKKSKFTLLLHHSKNRVATHADIEREWWPHTGRTADCTDLKDKSMSWKNMRSTNSDAYSTAAVDAGTKAAGDTGRIYKYLKQTVSLYEIQLLLSLLPILIRGGFIQWQQSQIPPWTWYKMLGIYFYFIFTICMYISFLAVKLNEWSMNEDTNSCFCFLFFTISSNKTIY